MSHSTGAIRFNDGTVRFYEYDGTADIVLSCHYATLAEVSEHWRNQPTKHCTCGREESVSIYSSYGRGYYFDGKACRYCCSVRPDEPDFDRIDPEDAENWAKAVFE